MTEDSSKSETKSPAAEDKSDGADQKPGPQSTTRHFTTMAIVLIFGVVIHGVWKNSRSEAQVSLAIPDLKAEKASLPDLFRDKGLPLEELQKQLLGANLDTPRAYVALYRNGHWQGEGWGSARGLKGAIASAYEEAKNSSKGEEATDAMLVVPTDRKRLRAQNYKSKLSNVHRGMRGIMVLPAENESHDATTPAALEYGLSPTRTVATNRSLIDALDRASKERDKDVNSWLQSSQAYTFDARQFFVPLAAGKKAEETLRGNRFIPTAEVTLDSTKEFTRLLGEWMFNNLHPGGRMTYMYYPSSGREARKSNNMIRQWMGTVAMGRVSRIHPELGFAERAEENIRYNLKQFYHREGDIGFIEYRNTAKLGAASLAMISLIESPARESLKEEEDGLMNLTLHQWQETGEMRTFFKPETRNDNHNFYPGETLLAWSFLYEKNPDPALLKKAMASYRYYKQWHLDHRNPAFIPWHTQAYYNLWKHTKSEELKDWIFTMNDWLVDTMQSNSRVAYDDTIGRFYAPTKRFGRPHASSTGVYIEGLIDAFALARTIGDKKRQEKYRRSIILGIRSSMQLQFVDQVDMFFVTNRDRLRGGIRTTVYDNAIRVDNVQHVLMGVQKVLREFEASDYHP